MVRYDPERRGRLNFAAFVEMFCTSETLKAFTLQHTLIQQIMSSWQLKQSEEQRAAVLALARARKPATLCPTVTEQSLSLLCSSTPSRRFAALGQPPTSPTTPHQKIAVCHSQSCGLPPTLPLTLTLTRVPPVSISCRCSWISRLMNFWRSAEVPCYEGAGVWTCGVGWCR